MNYPNFLLYATPCFVMLILGWGLQLYFQLKAKSQAEKQTQDLFTKLTEQLHRFQLNQIESMTHHLATNQQQTNTTLRQSIQELYNPLSVHQKNLSSQLSEHFCQLTQTLNLHLASLNESIETKLQKGFEKTNETFINIIQRLAIIDEAQQKITDLSKNVISLQDILADKRSRGAFGEVQLHLLIKNLIPEQNYQMQASLSNGTRVDCILLLPDPMGKIAIDAKFPLENYKRAHDPQLDIITQQQHRQQFKIDIRKHIQDIQQKYIISGETNDGALMFIPAEAIFAEIHGNHPDLVEFAMHSRVWLASPSTMMAILTTACSVLKDHATRQQVHIIQKHLRLLADDFNRFEKRMNNLSRHLELANSDAKEVHTSAQKISKRFTQIDKVDLSALEESQG